MTTTYALTTSRASKAFLMVFLAIDRNRRATSDWPIAFLAARLTSSAQVPFFCFHVLSLDLMLALAT